MIPFAFTITKGLEIWIWVRGLSHFKGELLQNSRRFWRDTVFNCHPSCLHDCLHIVMMLFGSIFHRCIERTLVTIDGARAINEGAWSQRTFPVSYTRIYLVQHLVPFKWRKCEDKIPPTPKERYLCDFCYSTSQCSVMSFKCETTCLTCLFNSWSMAGIPRWAVGWHDLNWQSLHWRCTQNDILWEM